MSEESVYLAVDLGAGSGRVIAGIVSDDDLIRLKEINRFETINYEKNGHRHWDIKTVYQSILEGLERAVLIYGDKIKSLGVDTWGVDYALLDENGELIADPFQYRDTRTDGVDLKTFDEISKGTIYEETGIQFLPFNTVYQLHAETLNKSADFKRADKILFVSDLISYWLSGVKFAERSIASTGQILNPKSRGWSTRILNAIDVPVSMMPLIVEPGTVVGPVKSSPDKSKELSKIDVVAVGAHDTASAVAGVPSPSKGRVYLSSGTWSLMGIETDEPIITEDSMEAGFSNEVGVQNKIRFLKNICGMWLVQECKRVWDEQGDELSYSEMVELAKRSTIDSVIDPDYEGFSTQCDMPEKIKEYCEETSQEIPKSKGEVLQLIFQSLAAKYKIVFDELQEFSYVPLTTFNIVGGGCNNKYLCQLTADALRMTVFAGPVEATSMGNIITQMMADGKVSSLDEGREMIFKSVELLKYKPNAGVNSLQHVRKLREIIGAVGIMGAGV